ncbi:MAG: mandelate racemase/muconate lactonizing enzyme family protein [Candidatus Thorarchaeota archaeon]
MVSIASFRTRLVRTHLAGEFVTTYGSEPTTRHHVMVWITADNGITGIGEACPLPFTADDDFNHIKRVIDQDLGPSMIGKNPFDFDLLNENLDEYPLAGGTARAGVDIALHDLAGKLRGVPIYQILGGLSRDHVDLAKVLGIGNPAEIAKMALQEVEQGAKAIKIKVGIEPAQDIETLKLVRDVVGDSVGIRADANTGYSVETALKVLRRTENIDLEYLEQPVAADDYDGLSQIRQESGTPIMADESLYTIKDAESLIGHESVDFFGLKLIKHGGIYRANQIASLAEEHGIECVVISPWETQIGVSAAVHLVLSGSNFNHPHEIGTQELADDPIQGLVEDQGTILRPVRPGLGVDFQNSS